MNFANCRNFLKALRLTSWVYEEFHHANDDENDFSYLLHWCSSGWNSHACLFSMPTRLDGTGRKMPALQMGW